MGKTKYCVCDNEIDWDDMIQCDARGGCREWYHFHCESLSPEEVDRNRQYACGGCVREDLATTTYTDLDTEDDAMSDITVLSAGVQTHVPWSDGDGINSGTNDTDVEMSNLEDGIAGDAANELEDPGDGTPASDENVNVFNQDQVMSDSEDAKSEGTSNDPPAHDAASLEKLVDRLGVGFQELTSSDWDADYTPDFGDFLEDLVKRNDQIMLEEGVRLGMKMRDEDWAAVSANKEVILSHLNNHGNVLCRQNNEAVANLIERYQPYQLDEEEEEDDRSAIALNFIFTWNLHEGVLRVEWRCRRMMQDAGESGGETESEESEDPTSTDGEVEEAAGAVEEVGDDVDVEQSSSSGSQSEALE